MGPGLAGPGPEETTPPAPKLWSVKKAITVLLGVVLLSGCGNNPHPPGETGRSVLYRVLSDDPKTLDPTVSYGIDESSIVDALYPAFFQYHYFKRDPYVLELALGAEEPRREPYLFTVREKGRIIEKRGEAWTFRIKRGLRFQDDPCFPGGRGREIVAADFLYSFRRMADPAVACPILTFIENKILGLDRLIARNRERMNAGESADYAGPVPGLQPDPRDPYRFRILLKEPYPQLRYLMAMHFTAPLAREAVARYGAELARHPVGCGAYVLAEYRPKQRLVLRANPNRRPEIYPVEGAPGDREAELLRDAGKPLPLVETVVYNISRESITGWNLFLQGYQDAWGVSRDNYSQVISPSGSLSPAMARRGITLSREVGVNIWYFAFNLRDPVFGGYDTRRRTLRQAISLAIDAQAFIDLFTQGNARKAEFLIPPGIFGYEKDYENPFRRHDPARAKELLAAAGYPGGIDQKTGERLTLTYDNTATDAAGRQFVGLLAKQLEAVGVRLVSRSWRANVFRERVLRDQFQFIRYSWFADYPDPENFVFLLYGPNRHPGPNHAGYQNAAYDRVFERMRAREDGPERGALIRRLREIAARDCPWIPLWHDVSLSLHHGWVANVKPHPIAHGITKYLRIDAPRRVRMQQAWNPPNLAPLGAGAVLVIAAVIPALRLARERGRRTVRRPDL